MSNHHNRYEPRYEEKKSNPHSEDFDPQFDPTGPKPTYHHYPQPKYSTLPGYTRTQPAEGTQNYEPDRYEAKKFDYRYDDRYYRQANSDRQQQQQQQQQQQPPAYEQYNEPTADEQYKAQYSQPNYKYYNEDQRNQGYDKIVPAAGRANNYNVRITDLLTSVKEPQHQDDSAYKLMEANKGYLVMMRFRPGDLSEVVTAVQETLSTLAAHNGYVIGFSEPRDMRILIPSNQMMASDQWWDSRDNKLSRFAVCCFWFKDVFQAKRWFESAHRIKQPDFPNSNPYQVIAVPLTYGRNKEPIPFGPDRDEVTLLWSEYPNIYERYQNDFLANYSEPARRLMKEFGANPNVSVSKYKAGWPPEPNKFGQPGYAKLQTSHERVGRAIRTGWVLPETFVTVSTFPTMDSVIRFYRDEQYQDIRSNLNRYSDPVFVAITLRRVKGTSK